MPGTGSSNAGISSGESNSKRSFLLLASPVSVLAAACPALALVGLTGLEPVTLRLSSACSNQLSYRPLGSVRSRSSRDRSRRSAVAAMVEARGFEPLTYSLQSYRSTN